MKAEVQATKKYHVIFDETEKLKLCDEISKLGNQLYDRNTIHDLRAILEMLV